MEILSILIVLSAFALGLRLRAFETVFAVILAVPIFSFIPGYIVSPGLPLYLAVLILLFAAAVFFQREKGDKSEYSIRSEVEPLAVFFVVFIACFAFCLKWPDFVAIGERLRDYAILSSILKSPLYPKEPWLAGFPMNYYVYWYRVGHVFHSFFGMPVWKVYPALQSFTFALYCTSMFYIFRRLCRFTVSSSIFCAVLIAFGSNISGVISAYSGDDNWWGPSRVITGAINEFPIWSFLLGDLHPHYLNLPAFSFLLVLFLPALEKPRSQLQSLFLATGAFIVAPLFFYNSNAWEVPLWLIAAGLVSLLLLIRNPGGFGWIWECVREIARPLHLSLRQWLLLAAAGLVFPLLFSYIANALGAPPWLIGTGVVVLLIALRNFRKFGWTGEGGMSLKPLLALCMLLFAMISLYLSSRHLVPLDAPLTRVLPPIPVTTTKELFLHFGFPLALIAVGNIALLRLPRYILPAGLLIAGSLLHSDGGVFLYSLLLVVVLRLFLEYSVNREASTDLRLALEALGLASICIVLIPEFFFMNDAYGGENERMNTIFKIYTFDWMLLHFYGFFLARRIFGWLKPAPEVFVISKVFQAGVLVIFLMFFYETIPLRLRDPRTEVVPPAARGLSSVEKEFSGAAKAITAFEALPDGIVIETQGNPYSYTTHVSTLAGKDSFLGWANHVQLLNREYDEISRREKVTDEFYNKDDCLARKEIMNREHIRYAVVGPLETMKYSAAVSKGFDCMNLVVDEGSYKIYQAD